MEVIKNPDLQNKKIIKYKNIEKIIDNNLDPVVGRVRKLAYSTKNTASHLNKPGKSCEHYLRDRSLKYYFECQKNPGNIIFQLNNENKHKLIIQTRNSQKIKTFKNNSLNSGNFKDSPLKILEKNLSFDMKNKKDKKNKTFDNFFVKNEDLLIKKEKSSDFLIKPIRNMKKKSKTYPESIFNKLQVTINKELQ